MECKTIVKHGRRVTKAALALLIGASVMQSCKDDDLLTGQPDWLGNSIYERLQEMGKYKYTLRMIDDLGQKEVLGHTGSKTLFVANDSAYDAWFARNNTSYDQLSDAQKLLFFNNSMINNAYLLELMSNTSGNPPLEGRAMRRETAGSVYDSVYVMPVSEMPNTNAWKPYLGRKKPMPILKDGSVAPMIHLLPSFMDFYKFTNEDIDIITNHRVHSTSESLVNGKRVVEGNLTCKNGYIHRMEDIIEPAPNMVEIMRQHPVMSDWLAIINRFSVPVYNKEASETYYRINHIEDSVFVLRYYNEQAGTRTRKWVDETYLDPAYQMAPNDTAKQPGLAFDPGWNQYIYDNTRGYDLHYDAGVMFVPTNDALRDWWDNGGGKALKEQYGTLDNVPLKTIAQLTNVNMKDVFTSAIPSKFDLVLNDAKEQLGITPGDVDSCFIGCNGIVYLTKKVFAPAAYESVSYPALAQEDKMNVFYEALDTLVFLPYLLSMEAEYALVLPTNKALLTHLDPATFGKVNTDGTETPDLIRIYLNKSGRLSGYRDESVVSTDGDITPTEGTEVITYSFIKRLLEETIDQLIIVLPSGGKGATNKTMEDYLDLGYHYFKTKGGALLYADNQGSNVKVRFAGGWQLEHNKMLDVDEDYTQTNGRSYQISSQVPMPAQNSFHMILEKHTEYDGFRKLLECEYAKMFTVVPPGTSSANIANYTLPQAAQKPGNFKLFDNYNYTVFVPSTTSIEALQTNGQLPAWDALYIDKEEGDHAVLDSLITAEDWWGECATSADSTAVRTKVETALKEIVQNFIRYHVQDHSVAIGMAPDPDMTGNLYESMLRNPETGRFYSLNTEFDTQQMTVTDIAGNKRTVQTGGAPIGGLYNNLCREYWLNKSDMSLFMCSDAVVHLIDAPLFVGYTYANGTKVNMRPWREVVKEYLNN